MTLRSAIFDSDEAFLQLEAPWRALAERAPDVTVFSSWEWQSIWWKYYGVGHQLRLLTVWDGERLVGLLPLYVARTPLVPGMTQRQGRLVGSGGDTSPDYLGALVDPEHASLVTPLLIEALFDCRRDWDTLRFTDMAEGPFTEALIAGLHGRVASMEAKEAERIQIARLPGAWEEYIGAMRSDRRYRLKKLRKGALEKLSGKFRVASQGDDLQVAFESLMRLHRKRWSVKDENDGAFRSSTYIDFHREVVTRCAGNGWIRVYCLDLPGADAQAPPRTGAAFYCYRYRDEVLYFQSGFDPDFERHSLGQVLMGLAIESALGEGARVFDLLKGVHAYKNSWANDSRATHEISACRATVPGLLVLGRTRLRHIARKLLDRRAPLAGPEGQQLPDPAAQEPSVVVGKGAQHGGEGKESH